MAGRVLLSCRRVCLLGVFNSRQIRTYGRRRIIITGGRPDVLLVAFRHSLPAALLTKTASPSRDRGVARYGAAPPVYRPRPIRRPVPVDRVARSHNRQNCLRINLHRRKWSVLGCEWTFLWNFVAVPVVIATIWHVNRNEAALSKRRDTGFLG